MGDSAPRALGRKGLLALVSVLLVLNLFTFLPAFSQISTVDSGCCSNHPLAKDFSAFYIGAWRLYHDPAQVYTHGLVSDGEPPIYPEPEQYKYLPSFLLVVSPFLLIQYSQAIVLFDILQFMFMPLIGMIVYSLTKEKGWAVTIIAEVLVLLLPAAAPGWGFSVGYFWQWKEAQSKVIETLLLTSSFYLGMRGRPLWSGILLGIAFYDPRFALVAVPSFLAYNRAGTSMAVRSLLGTLVLSNLALFYPGVAAAFVGMVFSTGVSTALYPYAVIPLAEVVFLSFVNYYEIRNEVLRLCRILRPRAASGSETRFQSSVTLQSD